MRSVYLDHSASTPVDPRVLEVMLPYFHEIYGNPHGVHAFARQAEKAVEKARATIADIIACQPKEVIFTSCGTEGNNLALRGALIAAKARGQQPHLITSPIEHSAVSRTARQLGDLWGYDVDFLPVSREGCVSAEDLRATLRPNTTLVSLMYANNEIGTVLPIADLAEVAHQSGALFHTDAVQAAGQLPLNWRELNVDMLSLSAHKFYAPKGVGALIVREGVALMAVQTGGSHERGLRAGTLNVPLIVGMAKALELAYKERESRVAHLTRLRDRLIEGILARVSDVELTGSRSSRLPSHASFAFKDVDGNQLLMFLDNKGIGASSGSACKTGNPRPSELLMALGYDENWALGGLRLSLGLHTNDEDIDYTLEVLPALVEKARTFRRVQVAALS